MAEPVAIFEKEYYDRLKEIEGRHWWTLGMTDLMERLLAGRVDSARDVTFLDIGCGSGIGLAWAARKLPHARKLGIDVSEHALAHCEELGAELSLASADELPYAAASVDLAICIDVLQHLSSDAQAVAEAFRVLKPGGYFYVRTNAQSFAPAPPGSRLYTERLLRSSLEAVGFRVERCSRVNFVGSLVAEAGLLGRGLLGRNGHDHGGHAHGHGHAHDEHHEHESHGGAEKAQPFKGGGYGGGLRLTAESHASLSSKLKRSLLHGEAFLIERGAQLPFGHSLIALAKKPF